MPPRLRRGPIESWSGGPLGRISIGSLVAYDPATQWSASTTGTPGTQTLTPIADHRTECATPPAIPCFRKEPPLGTCHRGGTFYVLRLPQQTVVSRPERKFLGPWREWHIVGIMRRSHCHSPTANESAWYGSTTRPRLPSCGRSQVPDAMRHGVGFLRIAHPELSILRSQTAPTTRCFREKRAHEMHQIGLSQAPNRGKWVWRGCYSSENRITTDTSRSSDDRGINGSPREAGDPPRLFHLAGKWPPSGTYHRGGTFYVLRLPQQTAASRSGRKIFGPWHEGHLVRIMFRRHSLVPLADKSAERGGTARIPVQC